MPSIKMKTKLSPSCLREKNGLHVCQKSNVISKKASCHLRVSEDTDEFDGCTKTCQEASLNTEPTDSNTNLEATDHQPDSIGEENSNLKRHPTPDMIGTDCASTYSSEIDTIFSPILNNIGAHCHLNAEEDAGSKSYFDIPVLGTDVGINNRSSHDNQTCDISDFFISDMIVGNLPLNGIDDIGEFNYFHEYKYAQSSILVDVADQYMVLPLLEDTLKFNNSDDAKICEEAPIGAGNSNLFKAMDQRNESDLEFSISFDTDQAECFDPQLFIKNLPELSDVISNFQPSIFPTENRKRKAVTLVLDLDETLVHSTLDFQNDADFRFTVDYNMKEHIVCVKRRPYLQLFLERVAEMFEVVIFTASQSIYAEQVLDKLDPESHFISRRLFRESCIFSDGCYIKDLTVLGNDLAKVVIIDNNPQVFRLQVNNGIPIKSWFDDPSDSALISLLPVLETLVDVDDVRPIIAQKFGNKE